MGLEVLVPRILIESKEGGHPRFPRPLLLSSFHSPRGIDWRRGVGGRGFLAPPLDVHAFI